MIALIAAIAKNNCIGNNGTLPWHLPEDLAHFKRLTTDATVMMGRKTWESLPEQFRPLPNRKNIVITRQEQYPLPQEVLRYGSPQAALDAHANEQLFIIGGAELYAQTIALSDRLYITHVDQTVDGDAFFPAIDPTIWKEIEREDHPLFSFVTYIKK